MSGRGMVRFPTKMGQGVRPASPGGGAPKPGGASPATFPGVHPLGPAVAALMANRAKPGLPGVPAAPRAAAELAQAAATLTREADRLASEGAKLIQKGRPHEAIAPLQRAVELSPQTVAAWHDLGMALKNAGRFREAAAAFVTAIRLDPRIASAHFGLGFVFDRLGEEAKAMTSYEAAVKLDPRLVPAQVRLGGMYLAQRRLPEARAAFAAVVDAAPGTVTARIAEARALEAAGAFDAAQAAISAVVEAYPRDAEALALLAGYLGQKGRSSEAAAHFERAAQLAPHMGGAWSGLATHRRFTADDEPLIARMKACLTRPDLAPFHRQQVHFALGKAYDDIAAYDLAMEEFEAANRIRGRNTAFDGEDLAKHVDQLIEATSGGFGDPPGCGVDDATPVLVVGLPRSGSTLTEQILSSHPDIAAGGELEFWSERHLALGSAPPDSDVTRRLARDYLATLRAYGPHARRVTDKSLNTFALLGVIHRVFPNATLIHCRRHPIDHCLSIFMTSFEASFPYASDRANLVFFHRQYQRLMAHWREVLPADRFIEVDYEDLVADPEAHSRRLIAACGLEWDDACLSPQDNPRLINTASAWQARQPIYRSSVERWRRYEPWLGELRELAPAAG